MTLLEQSFNRVMAAYARLASPKARFGLLRRSLRALCGTILVVSALLIGGGASIAGPTDTLVVKITGLSNEKGVIRIALFNSAKTYSDKRFGPDGALRMATLPIRKKSARWTIKDLPHGTYAIRVYHDEDEKGKFKVNRLGIPKYEYGFSNNARGMFGPPSFRKASFDFPDAREMNIRLHR